MRRAWLASSLCLALASCRALPAVDAGTCGNGVVEPAHGEDCDLYAVTKGSVCRQPGEARECRYDCAPRDDGTRPACPSGMTCGLDGTCNWPSGAFGKASTSFAAEPRELLVADVDGDRRQDLLVAERDRTVVHYVGNSNASSSPLEIPTINATGVFPVVAELSGDSLTDVVVPYTAGILTTLGSADRSLVSTAYPSVELPDNIDSVYYMSLELLPQVPGDETLLVVTGNGSPLAGIAYLSQEFGVQLITGTFAPDLLAGDVPTGNVAEDPTTSPCDEMVLPYKGFDKLYAFSPCKLDPAKGIVLNVQGVGKTITLPPGDLVLGSTILSDFDHDGHLDVALVASKGDARFIDVSYGLGDGTFNSTSPVPAVGDGSAAHAAELDTATPLAIGDLDGDGTPDFVDEKGAYVHRSVGWELVGSSGLDSWSEAVIADLNGNGLPDVLAARAGRSGADFLNGGGKGYLSLWDVRSDGALSHLHVGDYDGDLVADVAASEKAAGGARDFLSVMFGGSSAPDDARHMGLVSPVIQVASSRSTPDPGPQWAVDDVVAVSVTADKKTVFHGFGGRSDRQLRSPYTIVESLGTAPNVTFKGFAPMRLATGRFDGDDHTDIAEVASGLNVSSSEMHLWLVPMTGQADIRLSDARGSDVLPNEADFTKCELASGDLDGDGIDDLVLLAPAANGTGSLGYVPRAVDGGDGHRTWKLGAAAPLEWRFEHSESLDAPSGNAGGGRIRAADLDGDGHLDVIALAPATGGQGGALVLFRGGGSAVLGTPDVLEPTPDGPATAFALLQADRDRALELALLAGSHVYLADLNANGHYEVAPTPVATLAEATFIAAGDYDGDGVQDLAVGTPSSVSVFPGLPGIR